MSVADHPLHKLPKYGDGIGLHRVDFLMEACGIDGEEVSRRAIAITGSNGKGSTAMIASALLQATGERVGLFTSPHLYRYNERFRIDGEPVADEPLLAAMDEVESAVRFFRSRHSDVVGAFEAQFVVALALFRDCRWLVLEAGIGGRYDPVRLARAPVSALVSLDLEHTELLGNTLQEIAVDKLDAVAPGGTAILGESCLPLAEEIRTYASLKDTHVIFVDPAGWRDAGVVGGRQHFDIRLDDLDLTAFNSGLIGRHQINNHAVAIAAVRERLVRSGAWPPTDMLVRWRDAASRIEWPGRLETISCEPLIIIDVGHTPEGIKAALEGFRALSEGRKSTLVTGGSKNKHVREMLAILVPGFDRILCTAAHHNGLATAEVEALVKSINPKAETMLCHRIEDAVAHVRRDARDEPAYVAGGLFLAAEFAECWRGGDPTTLKFF